MKKILAVVLCLVGYSVAGPITMPSEKELEKRLVGIGQLHFNEKTKIARDLGGRVMEPQGVFLAVQFAYYDYLLEFEGNIPAQISIKMNKPLVLKELLKDSPQALQELEKDGLSIVENGCSPKL